MTSYTYPQQAPQQKAGTDVAAWALVALVVAVICAAAGWAIARNGSPSRTDVARTSELAAREAAARGATVGYRSGAAAGRRETLLRTQLLKQQAASAATAEGYSTGFTDGRSRAQARAYGLDGLGLGGVPASSYPSVDSTDLLASGAFGGGDLLGADSSAYSSLGYGSGVSAPYVSSSGVLGATSAGDSYGY
jgi:type II secretory pathway pseudopilin PulG